MGSVSRESSKKYVSNTNFHLLLRRSESGGAEVKVNFLRDYSLNSLENFTLYEKTGNAALNYMCDGTKT